MQRLSISDNSLPKKLAPAKNILEERAVISNARELNLSSLVCHLYDVKTFLIFKEQREFDLTASKGRESRALKWHVILHALSTSKVVTSTPISDGGAILVTNTPIDQWISDTGGKIELETAALPQRIKNQISSENVESIRVEVSVRTDTSTVNITDLSGLGEFVLGEHREDSRHITALATMQEASLNPNLISVGGNRIYTNVQDLLNAPGYVRATGLVKRIRLSLNNDKWIMEILADSTERIMFKSMNLKEFLLKQQQFKGLQFGPEFNQCPNWKKVYSMVVDMALNHGNRNHWFTSRGLTATSMEQIINNQSMAVQSFDGQFDRKLPAVIERNREGKMIAHHIESLTITPYQAVPPEKSYGNAPAAPNIEERYNRTLQMTETAQIDGIAENPTLASFKIRPSKALKNVKAYSRKHPTVLDAFRKQINDRDKSQWLIKNKFACPAKIDIIAVAHTCKKEEIERGVKALIDDGVKRGIVVGTTQYYPVTKPNELATLAGKLGKMPEKQPNILLIFVDSKTHATSHSFLKLYERLYMIRTQQITTEVVKKSEEQWITRLNILMKMNIKMGGVNVNVIPQTPKLDDWMKQKETLILSYDVSHPVPAKRMQKKDAKATKPSVVGFSGNYGRHIDGFVGDFAFQHPRVEQVDDALLKTRFANMLAHFQKNHGKLPKRVVIIRDGVSEGQYLMVIRDELHALEEGWKSHQQKSKGKLPFPPTAVFIGTKRNGIRLFVKDSNGMIRNVTAGTFAQSGVVRPNLNEWVMVAAKPIKGTAQPVTFQPIYDTIGMDNDERQDLMYYLCFLHQISGNTISLPEPLYQADEWAKRGRNLWNAYVDLMKFPQSQFTAEGLTQVDFDEMNERASFMETRFDGTRFNA
ncbi:hypothetical protein WR25_01676 [Diploscapter pachys]|uniref:Piwi domain-containing protein n=1 Tax=Diploscapter pachys TaxID=2018661 RepID=A0A2A2JS55_9BILA|nr:hypothetical protein WR25_01676 [Diploscapter pachys]